MTLDQLAAHFALMATKAEEAEHRALEKIGDRVAKTAKSFLGHEQEGWAELAEYTLKEKERLNLPSPSPLLRTGEHIRDTIDTNVSGHTVAIGSDDQVAAWQEEGTARMPPRPFLKKAVLHDEEAIKRIVSREIRKIL